MKKSWILLAAALVASIPAFAVQLSMHGAPAPAAKSAVAVSLRLKDAAAPVTKLAPVSSAEMDRITQANRTSTKRTAIGVERTIGTVHLPAAADMRWKAVDGGVAAQVSVSSPDAGALRLAIDLAGVPEGVEMTVFGSGNPTRLEGPVHAGDILDRTQPWWTPITDGDTQTIEFFVPGGIDAASLPLRITGAAHLFTTLASGLRKEVQDIGSSGSCNVDIKCSSLYPTLAFQNMRNAVAEMVIQDGRNVFLCTGQLLNDTNTSHTPWFFSANHCFDNDNPPYKTPAQMQVVANTLSTLWFFEAVTCTTPSNTTVPPYVQISGGSTYLYNNQPADVLMVKLNDAAPTGSFFAGWNATALTVGTAITVAHHPEGDLKKVSQGNHIADSIFPGTDSTNLFHEVHYTSGTTEGGSSGSGLFSFDGTEYFLRGALFGGGAACNAINDSDWYSQFDKSFSSLAPYLSPVPAPAANYTDLWWNSNESGWGLNLVQHASNIMFGVWFTYAPNKSPTWYTLTNGNWTTATSWSGQVYATTGPSATAATFNGSSVVVRSAGTATLTFSDANTGTFAYTVDGVTSQKSITRQPY